MKLETTGAFAGLLAIAVCASAAMLWSEPGLTVLSAENGRGYCPVPATQVRVVDLQAGPDLLLLMYGLSQGRGA
ncbi:hypothetical protein [Pseudomonas sp. N040]|uniref:hypothetical protein n=1 Tax=Pseudomonas sp. N040 TaxID=2785325 RepID=UPI0018A270C0|nr:hypothetical protein [Pseudomonas sp. N040]MBF7730370.1 hypothetical protein [Pseudomonas sp. N040]MBW7014012.1 hypothetical protein [Pseudomonas sp. N040]